MSDLWLDKFDVGNIDVLNLPNLEWPLSDQGNPSGSDAIYPSNPARLMLQQKANSITLKLKDEYKDYGKYVNLFDENGNVVEFYYDESFDEDGQITFSTEVPYRTLTSIHIIIANDAESDFKMYFLHIEIGGEDPGPDPEEPEEPEEPGEPRGTFVTLRNNDTLAKIVDVYDLFNAKLTERINGPFTFDFNILPYTNVYRIYPPNIVEIDDNYFHVRHIQKVRNNSLMMTVNCEHVSYELNDPPESNYEWTEDTYSGYVWNIMSELLDGSRFSIHTIDNDVFVEGFTTKAEGYRSRILELAAQTNAEVKWDKFKVSLVSRRGEDNEVTLEVGKNIRSMTQNIEVRNNATTRRSYEVDLVDLYHIEDDAGEPLEMHGVQLGDTVRLIDDQFVIDHTDRIVAITRDPYRKALPEIEFANNMNDFIVNDDITTAPAATGGAPEKVINLRNYYSRTIIAGDPPETGWIQLNGDFPGVLSLRGSELVFGLKLIGNASESAVLEGFIIGEKNSVNSTALQNSKFKTTVNPGLNTIGIPFAEVGLEQTDLSIYLELQVSSGTFHVEAENVRLYAKGRAIEWYANQVIS